MLQRICNCFRIALMATMVLAASIPCEAAETPGQQEALLLALEIPWQSVDGGGGLSTGGNLAVTGTIGQPETGTAQGGGFVFDGGLWSRSVDLGGLFSDGFESGDLSAWSGSAGGRSNLKSPPGGE